MGCTPKNIRQVELAASSKKKGLQSKTTFSDYIYPKPSISLTKLNSSVFARLTNGKSQPLSQKIQVAVRNIIISTLAICTQMLMAQLD